MTYIVLVAGQGKNLQPLTLSYPKTLYKLGGETTVLQRLVRSIRKCDKKAEIVIVVGFMYKHIQKELEDDNVLFVHNPFYEVTSSMGSLWFAKEYLQRENVTIINGDIVMSDKMINDVICAYTDIPYVLLDSTKTSDNKYNVQVQGDRVCVMSKNLTDFMGNYVSVTKLDAVSSRFVFEQLSLMVNDGMYNLFYEDALVQMIFDKDFELYYKDVKDYKWTEIDSVDDLLKARQIQAESEI
ncbi:MAG: NTP transferase domain-containing protein [Bacteroidaceae bacterium]|nr:NTP transferase domain-containing protein [Bacteroidaceae bacterium]